MKHLKIAAIFLAIVLVAQHPESVAAAKKVKVVATITTYGSIAKHIGGDRVNVVSLAKGHQDPHFVQPKLSLSEKLAGADLFIDTGLDLELWVPALQDAAGNKKVMSGAQGYVSATKGVILLEKVSVADRKEGDVHVYGNPHAYMSPLAQKQIARNVAVGLKKVDPAGADTYDKNLKKFTKKMDEALFGPELVKILGGKKLTKLAHKGKLIGFLEENTYKDKPLIDALGGWMRKALPLRGEKVVAYHKNWVYFSTLFGFKVVGFIEPKPGIPPSPKHIKKVVGKIKKQDIKILLAASYYDMSKIKAVAKKTGLEPVVVAVAVGGQKGEDDVFKVTDNILSRMLEALE